LISIHVFGAISGASPVELATTLITGTPVAGGATTTVADADLLEPPKAVAVTVTLVAAAMLAGGV
jgi:hypothetical protein